MNYSLVDCGELGWSLYLTSHANYLVGKGHTLQVLTHEDRQALYPHIADVTILPDLPPTVTRSSTGVIPLSHSQLLNITKDYLKYPLVPGFRFGGLAWDHNFMTGKMDYQRFEPETVREKSILIFPRYEPTPKSFRNLPENYYGKLLKELDKLGLPIVSIGKYPGSMKLSSKGLKNFKDNVSSDVTLQDVIDYCESAVVAIGSQSSLPKLALQQGVPTYMIGHEKKRHTEVDNPMKTKCGFYEVKDNEYLTLDTQDCVNKTMEWVNKNVR